MTITSTHKAETLASFALNPLIGTLYASFSGDANESSPTDRSKIKGFSWFSDDESEAYFIGLDGISTDFPDIEDSPAMFEIPVYARREVLRTFWTYDGRSPRVSSRELSINDVHSIIEYFYRTLRGDDLSDFRLYGSLPVTKNQRTLAILEDGMLAEATRKQTNGFFNQRRPLDANGRHFSAGSLFQYKKLGQGLNGHVVSREFDRVFAASADDEYREVAANEISIQRSKNRRNSKHSLVLEPMAPMPLTVKTTFTSFIQINQEEIYRKAADGGVTMTDQDGYSADAAMNSSMDYPMYQLYTPGGESLGIITSESGLALDDVIDAHLASMLFTDW